MEGVEVAGGGGAEPDGGVLLLPLQGGGGLRGGVAGQDLFEQLGRGRRCSIVSGRMTVCGSPSPTTET